jgi:hypothetical protein
MLDIIREKAGIISALALAIINALSALGLVLPHGVDAEGVALLNAAAISVGAAVAHFIRKPAA